MTDESSRIEGKYLVPRSSPSRSSSSWPWYSSRDARETFGFLQLRKHAIPGKFPSTRKTDISPSQISLSKLFISVATERIDRKMAKLLPLLITASLVASSSALDCYTRDKLVIGRTFGEFGACNAVSDCNAVSEREITDFANFMLSDEMCALLGGFKFKICS